MPYFIALRVYRITEQRNHTILVGNRIQPQEKEILH